MPVEIKELRLKLKVNENKSKPVSAQNPGSGESDTEGIIEACVEKVLKILKERTQR